MATALTPHKTALINGASSGVGYAMAHHFAREGYQLVLVTRVVAKIFQKG